MKKNLTIVLFLTFFLAFVPFTPARSEHAHAEECTHQWGEWLGTKETCGKDGTYYRDCQICRKLETKIVPATGKHTWGDWVMEEEASCSDTGLKVRTCSVCSQTDEKEIPENNVHSWGDWETEEKATALSPGEKIRICEECDTEQSKEIPKLKASISLKKKSVSIEAGKSTTLKIKSKTYGDKVASWSSSDKQIATVDKNGKVTGKQKGTATITLKMESGVKASCKVKVTKASTSTNTSASGSSSSSSKGGSSSSNTGGSSYQNSSQSSYGEVWIPRTGSKYHSKSTCSNMKSPSKVSKQDAINWGYTPCKKCY